jgi:hypothetical protein
MQQRTRVPHPAEICIWCSDAACAFNYISMLTRLWFVELNGPESRAKPLEDRTAFIVECIALNIPLQYDLQWYVEHYTADGEHDPRGWDADADRFRNNCEFLLRNLLTVFVDNEFRRLGRIPISWNLLCSFSYSSPWEEDAMRSILRLFRILLAWAELRGYSNEVSYLSVNI